MDQWKKIVQGMEQPWIIAGPCAIESKEQMKEIARLLKAYGVKMIRGGAFKPRTSPDSFQGLGMEGLRIMKEIGEEFGLITVSEIMDPRVLSEEELLPDVIQIGSRNMQNFALLKEVGRLDRPVLLKRGMASTVHEWLQAAAYVEAEGNHRVIYCERGIRTVSEVTRNTLDVGAIAFLRQMGKLVVADPSHASGNRALVAPIALAGLAAGAQGIMVEIHPQPEKAVSDGEQSLTFEEFGELVHAIRSRS